MALRTGPWHINPIVHGHLTTSRPVPDSERPMFCFFGNSLKAIVHFGASHAIKQCHCWCARST